MSTKGMIYPQETPMLAGNPKDSAIAANNQATTRQADLIKATSGGNRRRYIHKRNKYGGATTDGVTVPQYQMQYKPTGAGGQDPNSIIKQNAELSTQDTANSQYDNLAKKGGSRRKRGGTLNWGCYSGGRKKSRRLVHRKKTHKKRRTNRRK
jgi:hypothetical protein